MESKQPDQKEAYEKIEPQVPGIMLDHLGTQKPEQLRNQELYYRAIGR